MAKPTIISLGAGFDVGKDKSVLFFCAYLDNGKTARFASKAIKMTPAEIDKSITWLKAKRNKIDPAHELRFRVVMESTSRYHERFLHKAYEADLAVSVVQPRRIKHYARSLGYDSKNDSIDAKVMAHYACIRDVPLWAPFSKHILEIRETLRARRSFIKSKVRISNQLHALRHAHCPSKHVISAYERMLDQTQKEIVRIEKRVKALYGKDKKLNERLGPIIEAVPGVGLVTALTVVSETNGFVTTAGARQLARFAGYDVVENQSGNSVGRTRISKRGNAHIRSAMYMAAVGHIRFGQGNIVDAYERACERKPGIYKYANVIVQRKLLELIYVLWTQGTDYEPYHGRPASQPKAYNRSTVKSTSEPSSEAHGIAPSKEALPIEA